MYLSKKAIDKLHKVHKQLHDAKRRFVYTPPQILPDLPKGDPSIFNIIPAPIRKYILEHPWQHYYKYEYDLSTGSHIEIYMATDEPEETYREEIRETNAILETIQLYSPVRKNLQFFLYMTPFQKYLPEKGEKMGEIHINTGYHVIDTQWVYVYRKEEWLKVFCHETIHVYEIDGSEKEDSKEECEKIVESKETCEKGDLRSNEGMTESNAILLMILLRNEKKGIIKGIIREEKHEKNLIERMKGESSELIERYVRLRVIIPKNKFIRDFFLTGNKHYMSELIKHTQKLRDQGRGPWASPGPLRPTVPLRPLPYRGTKVHTMKNKSVRTKGPRAGPLGFARATGTVATYGSLKRFTQ